MMRTALVPVLVFALAALSFGCSDSCDELCGEQASFINGCLAEWQLSWDDIVDSEGELYGSAQQYRTRCRSAKQDAIDQALVACEGIEDNKERRKCEDTFELDIVDQCEGDKIEFRFSCATFFSNNVDPNLSLGDGGDDDSAQ